MKITKENLLAFGFKELEGREDCYSLQSKDTSFLIMLLRDGWDFSGHIVTEMAELVSWAYQDGWIDGKYRVEAKLAAFMDLDKE
jgi:hypothetical protein